jgi:NADPH-dependent glutamate synthase beta subunit-like oxidoreductase
MVMDIISDAKLRESMGQSLSVTITYAENAVNFLTIGDDRGSEYAIKKAASHFKQAVDLLAELKKRNLNQAKEEAYALSPDRRRPVRTPEAGHGNGAASAEPAAPGEEGEEFDE